MSSRIREFFETSKAKIKTVLKPEEIKRLAVALARLYAQLENLVRSKTFRRDINAIFDTLREVEYCISRLQQVLNYVPSGARGSIESFILELKKLHEDIYTTLQSIAQLVADIPKMETLAEKLKEYAPRIGKLIKLAKKMEKEVANVQFI